MSLFTDASLVVKPSLYKAGKLYSIKPGTGLGDLSVVRNSVKWGVGPNGVYRQVAANVPLIEYDPVTRVERGLLVEPGATNLFERSQEFDNAYWTKVAGTVSANATVAPSGETTADKLVDGAASGQLQRSFTTTAQVYTQSIFAKIGERSTFTVSNSYGNAVFDLTTGAVNSQTGGTGKSEQYPNGWWRLIFTFTATAATPNMGYTSSGTGLVDGVSGTFVWQAQLETGSVATSPIVTTAGTASRVADAVTLTGASSLIGQTSGTIYCEINARNFNSSPTFRRILALSDGTAANSIQLFFSDTSSVITANVIASSVSGASIASSAQTGMLKMAVAYANNDVAFYINGVQIGTDTSVTIPACSKVNIGSRGSDDTNFINDHIRSAVLFPTRKSNAELAAMTTL